MTDEKWDNLIFMVDRQFGILEKRTEPILEQAEAEQVVKRGDKEILIFDTPGGKMKLERSSRPLVLDKKYHYHKTAGTGAQVEYVYSSTEKTHSLDAFREVDGEWQRVETALPLDGS
jgi:hypothetical protein